MCKYCGEEGRDDCNSDIIWNKIELTLGTLKVTEIGINLFITNDKLELYMDDALNSDDPAFKETVKIKYCPFCGQDLTA